MHDREPCTDGRPRVAQARQISSQSCARATASAAQVSALRSVVRGSAQRSTAPMHAVQGVPLPRR
eukprot:5709242-Alexandrium_andersonii.AAC.1